VPAKYSGEEAMKGIEFGVVQKNMGGGYINSGLSFILQIQVELIDNREWISMVIQDNKEAKRSREKKEWETDPLRREK
jgi:hypothetical protein